MYKVEKCLLLDMLRRKQMSQSDLANRTGISKQQINAYVQNRQMMTFQTAYNISVILDCDMSELYKMSLVSNE